MLETAFETALVQFGLETAFETVLVQFGLETAFGTVLVQFRLETAFATALVQFRLGTEFETAFASAEGDVFWIVGWKSAECGVILGTLGSGCADFPRTSTRSLLRSRAENSGMMRSGLGLIVCSTSVTGTS